MTRTHKLTSLLCACLLCWACSDDGTGRVDQGRPDVGASDVGAGDVGAGDVGAGDIGADDIGADDIGADDLKTMDVGQDLSPDAPVTVPDTGSADTGSADAGKTSLCVNTGGTVSVALCCKSASDFPNTCLTGACGCSPTYSHQVKICNCGTKKCFDSSKGCVGR